MPEIMTLETFEAHLQQEFLARFEKNSIVLKLIEVTRLGGGLLQGTGRHPFSIIFSGAMSPIMPQAIYSLERPGLSALDVFLVPIGPDGEGMRYEAVFT